MNKKKIPILVLRVVWMGLLDGEIESRLVAFPNQDGGDVNASAERLAVNLMNTIPAPLNM